MCVCISTKVVSYPFRFGSVDCRGDWLVKTCLVIKTTLWFRGSSSSSSSVVLNLYYSNTDGDGIHVL